MCVDVNYLASTHIGTPDPRQKHPPQGQRLLVTWKFPTSIFDQGLRLVLTARHWDQSEELIEYPLTKRWSYEEFYFPCKLLTYKIEIFNTCGELVDLWEHHFWTELIDMSSDSVSSQPMQGSVIETP